MAQVTLYVGDQRIGQRGMAAPRRPAVAAAWLKSCYKLFKDKLVVPATGYPVVRQVLGSERIYFELGGYIEVISFEIDRTVDALDRRL